MKLFTPEYRDEVLKKLLTEFKTDNEIIGVIIVGSGAINFEDVYSDIDLCVVIKNKDDIYPVFQVWKKKIDQMFSIMTYVESIRGKNSYLHVYLLKNFLEVDIGFVSLSNLVALKNRWKIAFDKTGKIEDILIRSWNSRRTNKELKSLYIKSVNSIWHYVMHAVVAVQRNLLWKAIAELEIIRDQAIKLHGLRTGLETKRFRQVDKMEKEFLFRLENILVRSVDPINIISSIRNAVTCFFIEAKQIDKALGIDLSSKMENIVNEYLKSFE